MRHTDIAFRHTKDTLQKKNITKATELLLTEGYQTWANSDAVGLFLIWIDATFNNEPPNSAAESTKVHQSALLIEPFLPKYSSRSLPL